jgi:hypothetical protein
MSNYNVQANFTFNDKHILDIISSAIYDIGYWACIHNETKAWKVAEAKLPKDSTFEDLMCHILLNGGEIIISDAEDDEDSWELTLEKLLQGIKLTIENKYWDGDIDTIDGEIGDIIFQHALFNNIVFG